VFSYALKFIKTNHPQKIALKGTFIFFLFSLAWILFSDQIAVYFFSDVDTLTSIQSFKGMLYVSITSLLVYALILKPMRSQLNLLQQIQASETRLRAILDHSPSLISIQDIEGKILLVNKQFERTYKNSSQSLVNRYVHEIFPEDIAHFRTLKDSEVLETDKPVDIEETLKHKDGTFHTYITIKFPVSVPGQAPYGICSVSTDISDRVQAQQVLKDQQAFIEHILATNPNVIYVFDLVSHRHIFLSESVSRAIGYNSEEVIDMKENFGPQIIHQDDLAKLKLHHNLMRKGKDYEIFDIEYRMRHKNGEWRWFSSRDTIFKRNTSGRVESVIGVAQDITQQKSVETSLLEHQEKLKQTLNRLNESERIGKNGTWEYDVLTQEIWWSDSMHEIFDVALEQKPSQETYRQRIHPDDLTRVTESFTKVYNSTALQAELSYRIIVKQNQIKHIWVNYRVERDETGKATSLSGTAKDVTEQKQAEEKIYYLAYYDELTGLPNRTLLLEDFRQELATKTSTYGAVLQLDLDHFKTINECLGHKLGDILLKQVGQRIQSTQDETQKVYYVGGDEYYILIPKLSEQHDKAQKLALAIAESVRQNLTKPYYIQESKLYLSASFGVILFPETNTSADDLLKYVDIALSLAKKRGRNTIELYHESFQQQAQSRLAMEIDLREAIEREEFILYYQPQVDNQGHYIGAETLLRWNHPKQGMVPPHEFIPLAEKTGMILPIGEKVLMLACKQIKIWEENGYFDSLLNHISVNVSPRQFHQDNFETYINMILKVSKIEPVHLMLELTESVVIDNFERTIEKMHSLKKLGIRFSMDDFGTGYSSLSYLRRLPFDELKIDRSFVMDISIDGSGKAIAESIISIAKNLQMDVVAEGVEIKEEMDFLTTHGCLKYQGFLFAKPMPNEEFNQAIHLQKSLAD